jgi:phytanoyl-CoA hydroxylase
MALTKFLKTEDNAIRAYYDTYGYVVIEKLLDDSKIEKLLEVVNRIKHSKLFVFFSQDTHLPTLPKLTPEGFIKNSMLNPASLKLWKGFSQATEDCLVDEGISDILTVLSGVQSHVMMQNMFFDKSTGTVEHQDHYYLDSNPPGKMVAAWCSLEDIHEDAGCFFVLPGSHKGRVIERKSAANFSDHDTFVKEINTLINEGGYEYRSFPLSKGDVLFWHPYTIHGAYNNQDSRFSRKSLTAHYYPSDLKPLYASDVPATRKSVNSNIVMLGSAPEAYRSNVLHYARYIANSLRGRGPDYDMRRDSYT